MAIILENGTSTTHNGSLGNDIFSGGIGFDRYSGGFGSDSFALSPTCSVSRSTPTPPACSTVADVGDRSSTTG